MIANNIAAIVAQLVSEPKFVYGTKNELNLLADSQDWSSGVVMLYTLKPVQLKYTDSYSIDSTYSLYMQFLYLTEFDQYTSQNEMLVTQAYWMMKEFLVKLERYRETGLDAKFFLVNINDKAQSVPIYNKFDVNSTGVDLRIQLSKLTPHGFDPTTRPPGYVVA